MALKRQHLIDPEVCIRCNTCEETCPIDAVTHNDDNYVVDPDICNYCMDCISPCPTGAIDSWRMVKEPYGIEEQFEWDELPEEAEYTDEELAEASGDAANDAAESGTDPDEVEEILQRARAGQGGKAVPPYSAAHPYINVYTRDAPAVARVVGNYRITESQAGSDIHHVVLDFGSQAFPVLEGQSIGIIPPGEDPKGRPHHVRLYSVASPRDGERPNHNNVALTVKREITEADGQRYPGVASNYVCDLQKGDEVRVTGPFGNTFLMPNHPEANIIMVCTGTGSAPFRAMTERRRRRMSDAPGKLMLFFGARTPQELPYFGPLRKLPESFIDINLAFSRVPDQRKEYVQDRMRARSADLAALLPDENTYLYICGLKGMENGVKEALEAICREHGLDWPALGSSMRENGRFHVETY